MTSRTLSSMPRERALIYWALAIMVALLAIPEVAFAQAEIPLPYEKGLKQFQTSLQGPVPFAISLVGIVACGAMLIFGGEISGFMRTMIFIVLVIAIIVQAGNVVQMLGGKAEYDYGMIPTTDVWQGLV